MDKYYFHFKDNYLVLEDHQWVFSFELTKEEFRYYFYPEGWNKFDGWVQYNSKYITPLEFMEGILDTGDYIQPVGYKYKILPRIYGN